MTPDSKVDWIMRCTAIYEAVVRTVLPDRGETLFELPAGSADEWERLKDFDGL